jgi:hypothetical protein
MFIKSSVRSRNSVNHRASNSQTTINRFTQHYVIDNVSLPKQRHSGASLLSKLKSIDLSKAADVLGVLLWAVSIPFIFGLGAVVVV